MWSCLLNSLSTKGFWDGQLHINLEFKGIPTIQERYGRGATVLCEPFDP
jgi:hypothetical protein